MKMKESKSRELLDEIRILFTGHNSFLDAILPPLIFLVVNGLVGFQAAMWSSLALSVVIAAMRIFRKQSFAKSGSHKKQCINRNEGYT